jgi:hypothetical protein
LNSLELHRHLRVFTAASLLWFSAICCSFPVCLAADSPNTQDSVAIDLKSASSQCPLPNTFKWTSTGPLARPKPGWVSLKDFSGVVYNHRHIVYMSTVNNSGNYGGAMMTFTDWSQMATATQYPLSVGGVAPTLIYFTPKKIWVLMYEWGPWPFGYMTSTDPTNPSAWSAPHELYGGSSIDETVICNSTTAYLFFANDNGNIYRASMPIADFPATFTNPTMIMTDARANLVC